MSGETAYLNSLLEKYRITDSMRNRIIGKRQLIENRLKSVYGSKITTIMYSGSYGKDTAVSLDYDLDLIVYFRHDSFTTLYEMYQSVYSTLSSSSFGPVRRQKVSIGIDLGLFHIDVVPARLLDDSGTRDGNLYNSTDGSSIKTNIKTHIDYVTKAKCKPVIRIMKLWKKENDLPIKSFALELITIRALDGQPENDLYSQYCRAMTYIVSNIETVRLIDPANSNNDLASGMSWMDRFVVKNSAARAMAYDIRRIIS